MMEISKEKKEKKKRIVSIWVCILIFIGAFFAGMISKVAIKPAWSTKYTATWSEELGTKITDISYGDEEANKFDLYLPKDSTKDTYGLVIYLHAGGFTSGDKADDENMLAWLCSKGYVAAGINYTLRTDTNNASVLLQSNEIKEAIPIVVEEAKNRGYNIDKMTVAGGSAGHALAMIYAYRDAQDAPVPVVFTFGAVGPSCFYVEDWGVYGLDKNIVEVASGVIPSFAKKIYKEQMRLGKGTITIYEPDLLFEKEESCPKMVINRKNFNSTCNIKDSDLIAGLFPCDATEPIIEEACKYDKDFYVAMCGCVHFRNANIPYSESNSRLYQSYVIDLADRLVSNNKELVVDMLDDKYLVPYPIIYTKKK